LFVSQTGELVFKQWTSQMNVKCLEVSMTISGEP